MKVRSLAGAADGRVSHGTDIAKRVVLGAGDVPTVTNLSQATLAPGQVATGHAHADMWEVFLVVAGGGTMTVDGSTVDLEAGTCVVIEPGEHHELSNTGADDLVVTYFGVVPQR